MSAAGDEESVEIERERRTVACAAAGDAEAFTRLVRQHQARLFAFFGRMGLRQAEAEELAQDSFVRAWQQLARYDATQGRFTTWLYTIARRLALNHLERADVRQLVAWPDGLDDPACHGPGPPGRLELRQQQHLLQQAWRALPTADRSVLALAHVHGLALEDVARLEHCTPAAARVRVHRARQRLREALERLTQPRRLGDDR